MRGALASRCLWLGLFAFACTAAIAVKVRSKSTLRHGIADSAMQQAFETIYSDKVWGIDGGGSGSGSGEQATQYARSILRLTIGMYGLKSMIDAPCGSLHWMPLALRDILTDVPGFQYLGVDIVRPVLEAHQKNFSAQSRNMHFKLLDFTDDILPDGYDLIFCRDALQHLPYDKVISALEHFATSSARYLLVTSYDRQDHNVDVPPGGYWDLDLQKHPFLLSGYQHDYREHTEEVLPSEAEKHLLLYSVTYLQSIDFVAMRQRAHQVVRL